MKLLLRPQYSSNPRERVKEREIQRYRNNSEEEDEDEEEEEEEEEEDDVAPSRLKFGRAGQSDPPASPPNSKSSSSPSKKKQRKLKELSRPGPNGTPFTSLSPAMEDQDALFREKDKRNQSSDVTGSGPGTPSELQSATPMPTKNVLFTALDKFQKKDTYGVFSEPVNPEELPDYFDVIKNPMDFGTIRSNLERENYTSLEQLEKDVLLVCSNAMSYNASGTIYYRQARTIQELARKTFQSLRCDPEGLELERERKPALKTKSVHYSKKPSRRGGWGRSRFESTRSDLASGTSLAISGECADWSNDAVKFRKGASLDRSGTFLEPTGRNLQGHFNADVNSPAELSEELSGSMLKGTAFRDGRRELLPEENRRATYKPWNILMTGNDSLSVMAGGNSKQLVNYLQAGIQLEYAYARSVARFSAELGPAAWKIAAKKIEKSLPASMPFGPGWVGEDEVPHSALLLREESNDQKTATLSNAILTGHGANKVVNVTGDQACVKTQGFEGQAYPCSSTVVAPTYVVSATESAALPVTQFTGSHLTSDKIIKPHTQVVKEIEFKSASPVVESKEIDLAGANFASDVSQSRLLEIVSRNNKLMQWTSTKQVDRAQPVSSLHASAAGSIGAERRLDVTSNFMARESHDDSKLPSNLGSYNVASHAVEPSAPNYEDRGRVARVPESTSSQEHGMQDLNRIVNSTQSKMPGLQQIASNMSSNTPVFGFSSAQSRQTAVSRGDAVAEAWARSRAADLVHADATPRIKMQITSDGYYNAQQPQVRPFASVPQFMQQQTPLDMSLYMQSQLSWMHPQSLSKISHTISRGNGSQMADSSNSNTLSQINHMQTPVGAESPQSQQCLWKSLPSKHPFQHTSDFSHSIPPDLNVGFQSPKSPVRQSSGVLTDSQPDLALQL
ncbi:hypothetical protein KI387_038994 [Taxus chinensis]|uniref:Bromo domain-containing protein n=1 Tax=Taxus chinensis TaxID=29808 RepID=A0AA38FBI8_TAXCH|nr:hypothetical protein KI387_038994 [Taxus chinensis]